MTQILDRDGELYYQRAMLSVRTLSVSRIRRGYAGGPGALRMR
jgi:hypothetical protein